MTLIRIGTRQLVPGERSSYSSGVRRLGHVSSVAAPRILATVSKCDWSGDIVMSMQLPTAPAAKAVKLRGDYSAAAADYSVEQAWSRYTPAEHALWGKLVARQMALVQRYGAAQVSAGLQALNLNERIPRFDEASRVLKRASGWEIVAVPGLIPERNFFAHLAQRHFPVTV